MDIKTVKRCLSLTGSTRLGVEAEVYDGPYTSFYVRLWNNEIFMSVLEMHTGPTFKIDINRATGKWYKRVIPFTFGEEKGEIILYPLGWGKILWEESSE